MLTNPSGSNALTSTIIGAAIRVHQALGPGLLESVYSECMECELRECGLRVQRGRHIPLTYRGKALASSFILDLLVDDSVIVELKSVERLVPVHSAQVLTYLKLTGLHVALLINFNVPVLKDGLRRFVHGAPDQDRAGGGRPPELRAAHRAHEDARESRQ